MERDLFILSIVVGLAMCVLGAGLQNPIPITVQPQHSSTQQLNVMTMTVPRPTRESVSNSIRVEKQDMYATRLHSLPEAHCLYQNNALEHGPYRDRLQMTAPLPGVHVSTAEQPESVAYAEPEIITNNVDDIVDNIKAGIGQAAFEHQNEFPASVPYIYPGMLLYQVQPTKPPSPKPIQFTKANIEQKHVSLPVAQRCGTGQPVPENYNESPASVSYSSPAVTAYHIDPATASGRQSLSKHTAWTGSHTAAPQQTFHVNPALASSGTGYGLPANEKVNEFPADVRESQTNRTISYQAQPSLASQGSPGLASPANEHRNEFPARVNYKTNRVTSHQVQPKSASRRFAGMVSPANERQNEFPAALDR